MNDAIIRSLKNAKISELLLAEVARTGSVKMAVDAVLGQGTYERIASQVYEKLRTA